MHKRTRLTFLMIALTAVLCVGLFSGCGAEPDPLLDNQTMARELERLMDPGYAAASSGNLIQSSPNELIEAILRHNEIHVTAVEKKQETYQVTCVITAPDVAAALKNVARQLQRHDEITMDAITDLVLTEIEQAGERSLSAELAVTKDGGALVPSLGNDIIDAYFGGLLGYINEYDFGE
jgi:hypothetical protein